MYRAYNLQDGGLDTVEANLRLGHQADERTYDEATMILQDLGVKTVRLLTNNSEKVQKLEEAGIEVSERLEMIPKIVTPDNLAYLATKVEKMNHVLDMRQVPSPMTSMEEITTSK